MRDALPAAALPAALLAAALLLAGCPSQDDGPCEDGAARCPYVDVIQYCLDGEWLEEECRPRVVSETPYVTIDTVCYEEQGVCAP